ncbi:hypothetical protein LCGC14_1886630 [marine sediment metagenome]|uniref:Uncharacterized protein n=1 Tax=marine sediment metagenome TaxID=412755 RepID=A0A0F9IEN0_9ZZZZ
MASRVSVLNKPKTRIVGQANLENRLDSAELRREIHKSGICYLAIEMAKTGRRPVYNEESDEIEMEVMSEAAHVDLIKFIARKVLPDAREIPTVEEKATHDRWTAIANTIEVDVVED